VPVHRAGAADRKPWSTLDSTHKGPVYGAIAVTIKP
jgi:hypothetical protein